MQLTEADLTALAFGCGLLGAGGGGETRTATLMARESVRTRGPVEVVRHTDLAEDDLVLPCGLLGAPTVSAEKILSGDEAAGLVATTEERLGRRVTALMCLEVAGSNGLIPLVWAQRLGLKVVDADGIGRAFPMLTQVAMSVTDQKVAPVVITDERGITVTLEGAVTSVWAERLCRTVATVFGGRAAVSLFPMHAGDLPTASILGSISHALDLGRAVLGARDRDGAVRRIPGAEVVLAGMVRDVQRTTANGFVRGHALIQGVDDDTGRLVRVEFRNENLVALEDGAVVAATPTIISVLDSVEMSAIATEDLVFGQMVTVVTLAAAPFWYTEAGLEAAGPHAFGYRLGPEAHS
ncbi:DUF917 domain-containing protein [Nocardioides sp. LHD-245]|uniref:DUF917 domain-containing protein n=1 Tax=Nocardioides sp. LHD-245 TaxID=3051387 RepID=UPI0027E0DA26|nr:DUF917 domain-containing protein [Nocardioides sp. LHD-245]